MDTRTPLPITTVSSCPFLSSLPRLLGRQGDSTLQKQRWCRVVTPRPHSYIHATPLTLDSVCSPEFTAWWANITMKRCISYLWKKMGSKPEDLWCLSFPICKFLKVLSSKQSLRAHHVINSLLWYFRWNSVLRMYNHWLMNGSRAVCLLSLHMHARISERLGNQSLIQQA